MTIIKHKRKPIGRPSKRTRKTVNIICKHIADGMPLHHAAALGDIALSTFHWWRNKWPSFGKAVELARAKGLAARLATITEAAKTDWHAAAWYCEHVFASEYAKSRVEITGADGAPLAGAVAVYLPRKDDALTPEVRAIAGSVPVEVNGRHDEH